ncbi:MAG: DnaJ domain-containing protein [Actinobacteria bacterium]|nr:DnaJ domain-containing protein [Actinomycetota bacterium]
MSQRDWADKDYYAVLGVGKDATKDEIKRAYRKLAQKYHPDANEGDSSAEVRFKEISEAHSVLSNDEKRAEYNEFRRLVEAGGERIYGFGPNQGGGVRVNIGDILGDDRVGSIFDDLLSGGGRGFGFRSHGQDLQTETTLSFDDAVQGASLTLNTGTKVRVPPGVTDGARIKVAGKGGPATNGGSPGDLYVRVHVEEHPVFGRGSNGDILLTLPLTFTEAALGARVEVPTIDGSVTVKVPAGSNSGKILRVKERGAPRQRGGTGDLLVKLNVEVPQKLSKPHKDLLRRLAELDEDSPRRHLEGFIDTREPGAKSGAK